MKTNYSFKNHYNAILRGTAFIILSATLSGCVDRPSKKPEFPHTYTQRHPIVLRNVEETLDVYVNGNALDRRAVADLKGFSEGYKKNGKGLIQMAVPRGTAEDALAERAAKGINLVLKKHGIPSNRVKTVSYNTSGAVGAPPVKLTYLKLAAEVDSQCGLYPHDMTDSLENREYWNFGCSYQNQLALQIDDPRDLIQARQETPPDTQYRMKLFGQYRENGMSDFGDD